MCLSEVIIFATTSLVDRKLVVLYYQLIRSGYNVCNILPYEDKLIDAQFLLNIISNKVHNKLYHEKFVVD